MKIDKLKYFPKPLKGKFVGESQWELTAPFEYHSEKWGLIKVPIGFITDGASIPKVFHSVIGSPWGGKYPEAALPHDFLYAKKIYTRRRSDQIFLEAMTVLGVSIWKRNTMYAFVRMFGWLFWKNRKPFIGGLKMACIFVMCLILTGCIAHYNKKTNTMYSLCGARYKDAEEEFEAKAPLENILNIQGIKAD